MLAIETLGTDATAIFYVLSFIALVVATVGAVVGRINWLALGAALFVFVSAWNAVAVT